MNWFKFLLVCTLSIAFFSSCNVGKKALDGTIKKEVITFPYDFSQLKAYPLPAALNEVSGLTYDTEKDQLLAVEDERGVIYTLDKNNGNILNKEKFYKDGDYEGITIVGEYIYVLKSSGTIYKVKHGDYNAKPEKIKGTLKKDFDLEGLTYDQHTDGLIVSCKEPTEHEGANSRCLFRFDIESEEMSKSPFLMIKREELKNYIVSHFSEEEAAKFKKILSPDLDYLHLGPSGLAIHPFTKDIFILSSKSKCIMVYDRESKTLVYLQKLDKRIFEQPEGISFDTVGNLYITSEAKKNPPQLVVVPIL